MDKIEMTGKTVDEAIEQALKALSATRDEVEIEIVDVGSKGMFGIGSKAAKIIAAKKADPVRTAKDFIRELCMAMNMIVTVEAEIIDKQLLVNVSGDDVGILIGKRGQTLDAIQYLLNLVVNKGNASYLSVTLDTENYRKRRKDTLEALAFNLAKKVKATRKSVRLEPMNPYERRIIHSVLQVDKDIATHSEGDEPFRNVVITYKRP